MKKMIILLVLLAVAGSFSFFNTTKRRHVNIDACSLSDSDDIGYLINLADAKLGNQYGEINVHCTGTLYTQVVLSDNRKVNFTGGTYYIKTSKGSSAAPAFLLKNDIVIQGSGWTTKFVESDIPGQVAHIFFQSFNDSLDHYNAGSNNIEIRDLQLVGNPSAAIEGAVQAIELGNATNVRIDHVFFNGLRGLGVGVGAMSLHGKWADGVWITNNLFDRVLSQNVAVVNGVNVHIENNIFRAPGQPDGASLTMLDFEANLPSDRLENFSVTNNIFDARGASQWAWGIAIQSQNDNGDYMGPGRVSLNTMIGGDYDPDTVTNKMAGPIYLSRVRDVVVSDNFIRRSGQWGIWLEYAQRCQISGNRLQSTGGGGLGAVGMYFTRYTQFMNNVVVAPGVIGSASTLVKEFAGSDRNTFFDNYIGLAYDGMYAGYSPTIELLGPNSKAFNNVMWDTVQ